MSNSLIKYSQFDINKFKVEELADNERVQAQKIAYIKYNYGTTEKPDWKNLKMQLAKIKHEHGGIPREGPYYPDAQSRAHFKFSFCHDRKQYPDVNYDAIEECYNVLKTIDEYCGSEEFKKQLFGKNASQYAYQPIIRESEPEEDDDSKEEKAYRPPFTKIKLDLEYNPNKDNTTSKPTFKIFELIDGKRKEAILESFDDVVRLVRFKSNVRFIIIFSKCYAMKTKSGTEKKKYGIILKASSIESETTNAANVSVNEDQFLDSDEEDNSKPTITRNNKSLDDEDDDDEEQVIAEQVSNLDVKDDDDEEVEVLEEKPAPQKGKGKKAVTKTLIK